MKAAEIKPGTHYAYSTQPRSRNGIANRNLRAERVVVIDAEIRFADLGNNPVEAGSEHYYGTQRRHRVGLSADMLKPTCMLAQNVHHDGSEGDYRAVKPQHILMTWDEWEQREADRKARAEKNKRERRARWQARAKLCEQQTARLKALGLVEGEDFRASFDVTLEPSGLNKLITLAEPKIEDFV